ncbi:hypothetical protein BAXH7_03086 [Bacillus amyloliquefaciens XH7]|uniref:RBAM027750 n=1 Tax=Bacillus amyloliquefaciens (strain ATCC 23350 / DSM 7 / BCRC 11601 / CCUG 28519 / NBRC 15535 / NRRL B-14393 / F) TaxID=692420 RepID=A0A9P1JJ82_BACAS|nr:hypothetical protein LL3_03153 [Bacillus amyloliquefaciens LL3]AEK90208.1 hypothetical protein BAXH7_03086 [Bacillus amyloliquefaciens XH7]KYC93615.1 hypothetical protein B425_3053 [Bacillus amyloliquefaciens]CBI43983.1 RBAM027750 [Bacillus amyloliquefaciens DSM 7] [Bacillus amyloliquefaciens DSM 7 = ATCC 23350]
MNRLLKPVFLLDKCEQCGAEIKKSCIKTALFFINHAV